MATASRSCSSPSSRLASAPSALVSDPDWYRRLQQIAPMTAGLAVQTTVDVASQPLAPWAGLGVLAAWAAGALLVGGTVLRLRDA